MASIPGAPLVIVTNHLSYADANVIEVLLERGGGADLANRLTALAGPKIFTSRERRFSSLCFGTIKVPQSTDVASEEAVLNGREVVRAARHSIDVAHRRLQAGDALLLFGEGTRTRTGGMQQMLSAARPVDQMMRRQRFDRSVELEWRRLRNAINRLATTYRLSNV